MVSSFFGLSTLLRSLQAQQQALDTTNHNISNANTDGYSRQTPSMVASAPYTLPAVNRPDAMPLQIGSGVVVQEIRRQRDAFTDQELRQQTSQQSMWDTAATGLRQVEQVYNEPSDNGIRELTSKFFSAWSDLANDPQNGGARAAVRATGDALAQAFNSLSTQLTNMQQVASDTVKLSLPQVNDLGNQIAYLNAQIRNAQVAGDNANDMMDQRDRAVDQLVQLTGATYPQESTGEYTVSIGGHTFVNRDRVNQLTSEPQMLASGVTINQVKFAFDRAAVTFDGGTLGGQVQLRDQIIPNQLRQMDLLASTIAGNVNQLHVGGFGINNYADKVSNFFDPMTGVPLSQSGLANDIGGGTINVGGTSITIDPNTQSLSSVMGQIVNAINASPGVTAPATWSLDSATGKISLTYQSATPVTIGTPNDTSNFLNLTGLRAAPDAVTNTLTNDRRITGQVPVALFSARYLHLDQAIVNSLDAIAAASGPSAGLSAATGPGDNKNALALAAMQRTGFAALGGNVVQDFYATTVADLGSQTRQAEQTAATQKTFVDNLQARRESLSGVSLDEEATSLIKYQRAYQAAARGITTLDDMLDTIISRMGRVGL